ncbi:Arf GTPase arl1, partial [Nowakowskiella sp. JEL0078]
MTRLSLGQVVQQNTFENYLPATDENSAPSLSPPPPLQTDMPPTIGFNLEEISHPRTFNSTQDGLNISPKNSENNVRFKIWDLSGQSAVRSLWRCYYANADAIVYVVDASDRSNINVAGEEFLAALLPPTPLDETDDQNITGEPEFQDEAPNVVLLLANKQDLEGSMSNSELYSAMGLGDPIAQEVLKDRKWSICKCSAATGDGLLEAIDWLTDAIGEKHESVAQKG